MSRAVRVWVRRVILVLAIIGMIAGAFWDEVIEFTHAGLKGGDKESCPFTDVAQGEASPNGNKGQMPSLDDLPTLEELFPKGQMLEVGVDEMAQYGDDADLIAVGMDGFFFDVSASRSLYGKGGAYSQLAGKLGTRAIALSSNDHEDVCDDLHDFSEEQLATKDKWTRFFFHKYRVLGRVIYPHDVDARRREVLAFLGRHYENNDPSKSLEHNLKSYTNQVLATKNLQSLPKYSRASLDALPNNWVVLLGVVFDVSEAKWLFGDGGARQSWSRTDITERAARVPANSEDAVQREFELWALGSFLGHFPVLGTFA